MQSRRSMRSFWLEILAERGLTEADEARFFERGTYEGELPASFAALSRQEVEAEARRRFFAHRGR